VLMPRSSIIAGAPMDIVDRRT
jgi:hypothetical protein